MGQDCQCTWGRTVSVHGAGLSVYMGSVAGLSVYMGSVAGLSVYMGSVT